MVLHGFLNGHGLGYPKENYMKKKKIILVALSTLYTIFSIAFSINGLFLTVVSAISVQMKPVWWAITIYILFTAAYMWLLIRCRSRLLWVMGFVTIALQAFMVRQWVPIISAILLCLIASLFSGRYWVKIIGISFSVVMSVFLISIAYKESKNPLFYEEKLLAAESYSPNESHIVRSYSYIGGTEHGTTSVMVEDNVGYNLVIFDFSVNHYYLLSYPTYKNLTPYWEDEDTIVVGEVCFKYSKGVWRRDIL